LQANTNKGVPIAGNQEVKSKGDGTGFAPVKGDAELKMTRQP
jgi:hypothetical protein